MSSEESNSNCLRHNGLSEYFNMSLFDDAPMETTSDLINGAPFATRLNAIDILVSRHMASISIETVESDLFEFLLPYVKNLIADIFEANISIANTDSCPKSSGSLNTLKDSLKIAINVLTLLEEIMAYIVRNNNMQLLHIKSVPVNAALVVLSAFTHCKDSNTSYTIYFEEANELILLFKKTQEVHVNLLQVLRMHIHINDSEVEAVVTLQEVLEVLDEIGEVLLSLNVKSLAENWIGYTTIVQKYANVLNSDFNIVRPVKFLGKQIVKNIQTVMEMDANDTKNKSNTMKLTNFFIKNLKKLSQTFATKDIREQLLIFLVKIYNICNSNFRDDQDEKLFDPFVDFAKYVLNDYEFLQVLGNIDMHTSVFPKHEYGFYILLIKLFENISSNPTSIKCSALKMHTCLLCVFSCIENNYVEMFCKSALKVFKSDNVYDELVIHSSAAIILFKTDFNKVEIVLFQKLLGDNAWCSILALDIWCLILRLNSPTLCYQTLRNVVCKVEEYLKANFSTSPKLVYIKNFISQAFQMLPDNYKNDFVNCYPLLRYLHIWKCIGLQAFPNSHSSSVAHLLSRCMDQMEAFSNKKGKLETLTSMCLMWEIVATVNIVNINTIKLFDPLVSLWAHHSLDEDYHNNVLCHFYVQSLFLVTNRFIKCLSNSQLLPILKGIKALCDGKPYMKKCALDILDSLSDKSLGNQEQSSVVAVINNLFNVIFQEFNPIIKQHALEVQHRFILNSPYDGISQNAVDSAELRLLVSNFVDKNVDFDPEKAKQYLNGHVGLVFKHRCSVWPQQTQRKHKKMKMDTDRKIEEMLEKIKSDVDCLSASCTERNLSEGNVSEISVILNKLQNLV